MKTDISDFERQLSRLDHVRDMVLILGGKLEAAEAKLTRVQKMLDDLSAGTKDPPLSNNTLCCDLSRDELSDMAYAYEEYWWNVKECLDRVNAALKGGMV